MRMLLASLLLLAATASAADRTTLRDVVGLRLATCEAVYLLHVDGYTFARFEDLRAESSAPNQFGFPTFSIADDVAYASGVVDADRAAQPVVMVVDEQGNVRDPRRVGHDALLWSDAYPMRESAQPVPPRDD